MKKQRRLNTRYQVIIRAAVARAWNVSRMTDPHYVLHLDIHPCVASTHSFIQSTINETWCQVVEVTFLDFADIKRLAPVSAEPPQQQRLTHNINNALIAGPTGPRQPRAAKDCLSCICGGCYGSFSRPDGSWCPQQCLLSFTSHSPADLAQVWRLL